eukprot:Gb_03278 [translate_table: standard]
MPIIMQIYQTLKNLLANNCKIRFWKCSDLFDDICKRATIHILQNYRYDTIIIKSMVANYNIWTL